MPLKDFRRIAEAMVDAARPDMNPDMLVEAIRQRIGSLIIQTIVPVKMPLPVITLDGELEGLLAQAMRVAGDAKHPIEPALSQRLIEQVSRIRTAARLTGPQLRDRHVTDRPPRALAPVPAASAENARAFVPRNSRWEARRSRRRGRCREPNPPRAADFGRVTSKQQSEPVKCR